MKALPVANQILELMRTALDIAEKNAERGRHAGKDRVEPGKPC